LEKYGNNIFDCFIYFGVLLGHGNNNNNNKDRTKCAPEGPVSDYRGFYGALYRDLF
jgi:hypothetical protein